MSVCIAMDGNFGQVADLKSVHINDHKKTLVAQLKSVF
jgi:hypothetical protein